MRIAVVSDDVNFVAAVTGFAGAMGHEIVARGERGQMTVLDGACVPDALAVGLRFADGLTTVVFVASGDEAAAAVRFPGVLHVHPRRTLPVELPRLIELHAER